MNLFEYFFTEINCGKSIQIFIFESIQIRQSKKNSKFFSKKSNLIRVVNYSHIKKLINEFNMK